MDKEATLFIQVLWIGFALGALTEQAVQGISSRRKAKKRILAHKERDEKMQQIINLAEEVKNSVF